MSHERRRRWQSARDRARVAAELIEEAESLTQAAFLSGVTPAVPLSAETPVAPPPPNGNGTSRPAGPAPDLRTGDAALVALDRELAADPANPIVLARRAALLAALGRYAAAQRDLALVVRDDPGNADALVSLGTLLSRRGLWTEAAVHLRQAAALDPAGGPAWYYLGEALNHLDDLAGALAAFARAAELQPQNPKAFHGQGVVLDRMHRPADATVMYRRAREVAGR